jgi:hypothetical protein
MFYGIERVAWRIAFFKITTCVNWLFGHHKASMDMLGLYEVGVHGWMFPPPVCPHKIVIRAPPPGDASFLPKEPKHWSFSFLTQD